MALAEADFKRAIEAFDVLVRDYLSCKEAWDDVGVLEKYGTKYLRITRPLPTHAPSTTGDSNKRRESEGEIVAELEDDDPDALVKPVAKRHESEKAVFYDMVYSPSYQVPVLYLTFADAHSNKSVPLPSPNEIYELLVPDDFKTQMRDVGVMGALSMAEHPVTGVPACFVHPCRTQEVMAPLTRNLDLQSDGTDLVEYLMLWLGTIGASVGLSVPLDVAKLVAKRRGDAR